MTEKRYAYRDPHGSTTFMLTPYATDLKSGMEVYAVGEPLTDAEIARLKLEAQIEEVKRDEARASQRRESLEIELRNLSRSARP